VLIVYERRFGIVVQFVLSARRSAAPQPPQLGPQRELYRAVQGNSPQIDYQIHLAWLGEASRDFGFASHTQ